ncbi:MAG: hypothetical protein IJS51_11405, partial [Treponema sp.]|nr:hypothetical protein [Treponema sp.]
MKEFNRLVGTAAAAAALLFSLTILSCSSASDGPSVLPPPQPTPTTPLTLEAAEAGAVVTFSNTAAGPVTYTVNGGEAQTIASGATENITLANVDDKVEFFGDNKAYATSASNYS